ncbi:MAG: permease [Verrucomicrobiota bacterium]|nr:permease [Verrucomicrobiota bacterium]
MDAILHGLYAAAAMLWQMLWALVLGFGISALMQVFVSKEKMAQLFGRTSLQSVGLAMGLGAASSSCSYAAAAASKTAFKKGADLVPSLAFLLSSTNLVIELGIVLWMLMGWRFVLAEVAGAFVMVAIMWLLVWMTAPRKLVQEAREHNETGEGDDCCHGGGEHDHQAMGGGAEKSTLTRTADAFFMDWSMLWKEILAGVLIAGFLMALVPERWWEVLFIHNAPYTLRLFENAFVGPLVAVASFVCSVGNIPLATLLWASGCGFGGVIAFIYGDLIVIPLIAAYRKYYGTRAAAYITAVLFASMVGAGIIVDLLFKVLGLIPPENNAQPAMAMASFEWNYTTWLNFVAIIAGGVLLYLHFRNRGGGEHAHPHGGEAYAGHAGH